MSTTTGQLTLAQQLSQPIKSVEHLLGLLLAQLDKLGLVHAAEKEWVRRFNPAPAPAPAMSQSNPALGQPDHSKTNDQWLKRQLGLVQRAILVLVYADWAEAVRAEGGGQLVVLAFARWFIPITKQSSNSYMAQVSLSAYSVISSALSNRKPLALLPAPTPAAAAATAITTAPSQPSSTAQTTALHPESLAYSLQLMSRLSKCFSLPEIWDAVYGTPAVGGGATAARDGGTEGESDSDPDSDGDDHYYDASLRNEAWEASVKDVFGLATRVANACGLAGVDPPSELEYE